MIVDLPNGDLPALKAYAALNGYPSAEVALHMAAWEQMISLHETSLEFRELLDKASAGQDVLEGLQ